MLLRDGSADLLIALQEELAHKTVLIWNSRIKKTYEHYVPWMSCIPDADAHIADHAALNDTYGRGAVISTSPHLDNIDSYFRLPQCAALTNDLAKNLPNWTSASRITEATVSPMLVEAFAASKKTLVVGHPLFGKVFDRLVNAVVLLHVPSVEISMSTDLARGAIFMSFSGQTSTWDLSLSLAHELGHQALMILNSVDPLIASDITAPVFSGVRLTDRPAIQSLHAATALAFMSLFTASSPERQAKRVTAEFVEQLRATLISLQRNCTFTELGQELLNDYQRLCDKASSVEIEAIGA